VGNKAEGDPLSIPDSWECCIDGPLWKLEGPISSAQIEQNHIA